MIRTHGQPVPDSERLEVEGQTSRRARCDGGVLGEKVRGEVGAVVAAISALLAWPLDDIQVENGDARLRPNCQIIRRKVRKARIREEDLQELPHIRRSLLARPDALRPVREAHADRLVDEQHVRLVVPRIRVERHGAAVIRDAAGPELLQEADHAGAAGPTVEPEGERCGRGIAARVEVPEPAAV